MVRTCCASGQALINRRRARIDSPGPFSNRFYPLRILVTNQLHMLADFVLQRSARQLQPSLASNEHFMIQRTGQIILTIKVTPNYGCTSACVPQASAYAWPFARPLKLPWLRKGVRYHPAPQPYQLVATTLVVDGPLLPVGRQAQRRSAAPADGTGRCHRF